MKKNLKIKVIFKYTLNKKNKLVSVTNFKSNKF